jgi:hypothetical protein
MKRFATILLLTVGIISGATDIAKAESGTTVSNAPEELTSAIAEIEKAANNQDLDGVIENYSNDFTNTDGLTTDSLTQALKQMWKSYPQLKYTTEINSWSRDGNQLIAETTTTIQGMRTNKSRKVHLNSTIKSRQYFQKQKLVRQEILAEQSQLTSGNNPPQVQVVAPENVNTGEKYNFDLIVDEPLNDKLLLGAVQEEKTASNLYLNSTALELEALPAGGIYKTATAPLLPDSKWLSAILVRGDGIVMITHRVNIQEKPNNQEKK